MYFKFFDDHYKFIFLIYISSERPEWYVKSLKNLIYESSSLTNPLVKNLIQAEKKLFKKEEEELSEIDQICEGLDTKKDEILKHCEEGISTCVELEDTNEGDYEDDFEEMSEEEEVKQEESQSEDSSSTTSSKSSKSTSSKSASSKSTSSSSSSHSEDETDSSELSSIEHHPEVSTLDKDLTVSATLCQPETSLERGVITTDSVTVVDKITGDQPIKAGVGLEADLAVTSNVGLDKAELVKCSTNTDYGIFNQENSELKPSTKSMLKIIPSESSTKKEVSFKMIVHGKFYMKNSTLKENSEDFVLALKQPQQKKFKVPSRKIGKTPLQRYRPVSRTPLQMPKIKHFGKLPDEVDQPEEKITAADIFGPSKDNTIFCGGLPGDEDDRLNGNLDDAMDFLLNM